MTGQGKRARSTQNDASEIPEVLSNNEVIRALSQRITPLVDSGKRFASERPGLAFGITFGVGILVGGAFVSRLGRVLLLGAVGSVFELLMRQAPRAIEHILSQESESSHASA